MPRISKRLNLPDEEIEIKAARSQGPGGQNVNKVSSAARLRFDIRASSLPDFYKERLLSFNDRRISKEGIIVIKAQSYRSLKKNKEEAMARLRDLIKSASSVPKKRKPTQPTKNSQTKRVDDKVKRGRVKNLRSKKNDY